MGYTDISAHTTQGGVVAPRRYVLHASLFVATFVSTIIAGTQWAGKDAFEIVHWQYGITYAVLLMLFITAHEFGHYIAARIHKVEASLPFYIPVPFIFPFGTMGAVIKTYTPIYSRKALFDIGVAGPLAGFVVSLITLIIGFLTLPGKEFLYEIHPEYRFFGGAIPIYGLYFGDTLLFRGLAVLLTSPGTFIPPMNEMYHYPFLCAGWFGLFVTSLNLLPIGQLDGGHITYAMFGRRQHDIGRAAWIGMILYGFGSVFAFLAEYMVEPSPDALYTTLQDILLPILLFGEKFAPWYYAAWGGWLMWAVIARFWFRIEHPPLYDDATPLGAPRMIVGWLAIFIFIVSFVPTGIYEIPRTEDNAIPNKVIEKKLLTENSSSIFLSYDK